MIRIKQQVPSLYTNNSRDFQLFERLYEAVFNTVKTSVDMMLTNPISKNSDRRFLPLFAKTIGFESKHNYIDNDLYAICSCLQHILKIKGTKEAIEQCIKVMLRAQGLSEEYAVKGIDTNDLVNLDLKDSYNLKIYVPQALEDLPLLEDLLDYILPCGFIYELIVGDVENNDIISHFVVKDTVKHNQVLTGDLARNSTFVKNPNGDEADKENGSSLATINSGVVTGGFKQHNSNKVVPIDVAKLDAEEQEWL